MREILEAIAIETGRAVPHLIKPSAPVTPPIWSPDASAAREVLRFSPGHSDLATIIRTAWAWHRKAHR